MELNTYFEDLVENQKSFNGKPYKYWKDKADEHVMESLVRAAYHNTCSQSLIGYIACKRLLAIAEAMDPDLLKATLKQREKCLSGFATIVVNALGDR